MDASLPPHELKQKVAEILEVPLADIEAQDGPGSDVVWDSLVHVRLMMFLEEQLHVEITEESMEKYAEIGALRRLLSENTGV